MHKEKNNNRAQKRREAARASTSYHYAYRTENDLDDGVNNMMVWNIIKQEIKNKNPKSQRELEDAADEVYSNLSLTVVRSCIKKTQTVYSHIVTSY